MLLVIQNQSSISKYDIKTSFCFCQYLITLLRYCVPHSLSARVKGLSETSLIYALGRGGGVAGKFNHYRKELQTSNFSIQNAIHNV